MKFSQHTLFDMPEGQVTSPPLLRVPDEVYEVSLRVQIDARTGELAMSRQVKSALTDELIEWQMSHSPDAEQDVGEWLSAGVDNFRRAIETWRSPF